MAKTQEELQALRAQYESLKMKLAELSDEELAQVVGGNLNGTECPYGKISAGYGCNIIDQGNRCSYTNVLENRISAYGLYLCIKGCGTFDDQKPILTED